MYKSRTCIFALPLTINEILTFEIFDEGPQDMKRLWQQIQRNTDTNGLGMDLMKIAKIINLEKYSIDFHHI